MNHSNSRKSRDCTGETKAKSCYKCGQEGHIVSRITPLTPRTHSLSLVTALMQQPAVVVVVVAATRVDAITAAPSAIAAARLDTLHAAALALVVVVEKEEIATVDVVAVAEDTIVIVEETEVIGETEETEETEETGVIGETGETDPTPRLVEVARRPGEPLSLPFHRNRLF